MDWNDAFLLINALVLPGWLLLILAPRAAVTATLVHSILYPVVMSAIYVAALAAGVFFAQSAEGASFNSLEGVMAIFDHPNGVIIGWTHYLVFDLFVGAWIGRDAIRQNLPHLLVVPCLIGAFIFGPVGLLLYVLLRAALRKTLSLYEE